MFRDQGALAQTCMHASKHQNIKYSFIQQDIGNYMNTW